MTLRLAWLGFLAMIIGYEWLVYSLSPSEWLALPIVMTAVVLVGGWALWRAFMRSDR